ncbi:MAG: hypothetical protein Fur0014_07860 [Rubrivivax sp.]
MDLTWALLALAAVVIAAIALQGWWMARGARERRPPPAGLPVLDERVDPPIDGPVPPDAQETLPAPAHHAPRRWPRLDALVDAIVPLALEAPASGDFLLLHLPPSRRAGSKPFLVEGLDLATGEWEPLQPGRRYAELQAGVLLANRSGPLNEIEFSEFVQKVQAFADAVGAVPEVPDMLDVVARARELDQFASPLDAQLTLTLKSEGPAWSIGFLQQTAARHGFVPGTLPGRLVMPGAEDGDPPVLVLSFDPQAALEEDPQKAAVRQCQLSLDVPQTAAAAEPFPAWHNAARKLSDDLAATVVDDYGEPLTVQAFAVIDRELRQLYAQLEARDLAAGSPAARRLFS